MKVKNYTELMNATLKESEIELLNSISLPNSLILKRGTKLIGNEDVILSFINGGGIVLEGDNEIRDLSISTKADCRAIYIDSTLEDLGKITLKNLTVTGVVQLLTRGENKKLDVEIDGLDIVYADARNFPERPMKYGVIVYQGSLTIYNFNPKEGSIINVDAKNISIGRKNAPVLGSGVFISGFNDEAGAVEIKYLSTNEIHSNGMIPTGQPNLITGAIFIVYGAHAKKIESKGPVRTYGTNDMVLDVWGVVDDWICEEKITSHGPSAIGFVNFGTVKKFVAKKEITTLGLGARGFNQYDGTIEDAYFESISTAGDGSIGMQFSKPVGKITVGSVKTTGETGETLVKGVIKVLQADAISVVEGGEINELIVEGDLLTEGEEVVTYHVNGGKVHKFEIAGDIVAKSKKSKRVLVENGGKSGNDSL